MNTKRVAVKFIAYNYRLPATIAVILQNKQDNRSYGNIGLYSVYAAITDTFFKWRQKVKHKIEILFKFILFVIGVLLLFYCIIDLLTKNPIQP